MSDRIAAGRLADFAVSVFTAAGLDRAQAETAAAVVCFADMRGHTTHGTYTMSTIYAPRLRDGRISTGRNSVVLNDSGACRLVDARRRLGLVVATEAMDMAVERARALGVGLVAVRNSSHFGSAGFYTQRAADQGMIGIAMTNCGAQAVAPPLGGARRMLGTNPLSVAVPTGGDAPLVLDMSTTVVATGKLRAAQLAGRPVPVGWLTGDDGQASTDPARYYDGTAELQWLGGELETGGAKGFGLGLIVEMLCGALSGAAVGPRHDASPTDQDDDIGHFLLAIDPSAVGGQPPFLARADGILDAITTSRAATGRAEVLYPGLPEARQRRDAEDFGVELPDHVWAALDQLAADFGVPELDAR